MRVAAAILSMQFKPLTLQVIRQDTAVLYTQHRLEGLGVNPSHRISEMKQHTCERMQDRASAPDIKVASTQAPEGK